MAGNEDKQGGFSLNVEAESIENSQFGQHIGDVVHGDKGDGKTVVQGDLHGSITQQYAAQIEGQRKLIYDAIDIADLPNDAEAEIKRDVETLERALVEEPENHAQIKAIFKNIARHAPMVAEIAIEVLPVIIPAASPVLAVLRPAIEALIKAARNE